MCHLLAVTPHPPQTRQKLRSASVCVVCGRVCACCLCVFSYSAAFSFGDASPDVGRLAFVAAAAGCISPRYEPTVLVSTLILISVNSRVHAIPIAATHMHAAMHASPGQDRKDRQTKTAARWPHKFEDKGSDSDATTHCAAGHAAHCSCSHPD